MRKNQTSYQFACILPTIEEYLKNQEKRVIESIDAKSTDAESMDAKNTDTESTDTERTNVQTTDDKRGPADDEGRLDDKTRLDDAEGELFLEAC